MHDHRDPEAFAAAWIEAWNTRDLDRILSHYTPDATFRSPRAAELTGSPEVRGIEAMRAYWAKALAAVTDLRFTLDRVVGGEREVVVIYVSERDGRRRRALECFRFEEDGRVSEGEAFYGGDVTGEAEAGATG